jgi:hypothetical protein
MTSGVPITFTQGPFVELPVLSSVNIRVNLVGSITDPNFGGNTIEEDSERPRPIRPQSTTITVSNSHMITDSNFEGVHSASTRATVNDRLGSSHEISFTITYRIESLNP